MAADATNWREGLEQVGTCPHCGVPVYVRPGDVNGTTLLPTPVYLCACRHLAVSLSSVPVPPAPPPPWQPARPSYPCVPASPALPAMPPQPWQTPSYEGPPRPGLPPDITCTVRARPAVEYEDPTHPGLPPYTHRPSAPGGDY